MRWNKDVVDLLLSAAAAYLFVVNCADGYRRIVDASDYAHRLANYEWTCV